MPIGGKLNLKGVVLPSDAKREKKKKKKMKKLLAEGKLIPEGDADGGPAKEREWDIGSGYAPLGEKNTKTYEEMFPAEQRRFGVSVDGARKTATREEALELRVKKKADRYCK
mmetsp:Transcript_3168/g.11448  ORF Transcript_3168/g.11448 Transcript_3168/m.11448 type:complete len:112 (-) Transcript_3168:941-1276(-)